MARQKKQTVEYFPHFVSSGKTLFILENSFGNDGYAFWFKLLEVLGDSDGHYYDCSNISSWKFLLAKTKVNEDIALKIINTLVELNAIDEELWKNKIIWCDNFVENLQPVYTNRKCVTPTKPNNYSSNDSADELLLVDTSKNYYNSNINLELNEHKGITTNKSTQSIVKESKEKKSIDVLEDLKDRAILPFETYDEMLGLVEREFKRQLSKTELQKFEILFSKYGFKRFKLALIESVIYRKQSLDYMNNVLKAWDKKEYTLEQLAQGVHRST